MTGSNAVFLSYASQDSAAAKRICEALSAAGIEVWLDTAELRGGDVWDQKIRRQIRDCALFVPIISAHTQARAEGYFRLEWRLADQRTYLMGRNRAFLLPVCIDDLRDADLDVPESFSAVQWTWIPPGATPSAFVERVASLLAAAGRVSTAPSDSHSEAPARGAAAPLRPVGPVLLGLTGAVIAGLAIGFWVLHRNPTQMPSHRSQPAPSTVWGVATPTTIPEKSVAVLAFADMSQKKDQEYFSDGLTEELIDLLSQLSDLRVPARTSSFYFKGKNEPITKIAQQLRVANVLEGSVRKAGKRLRITAQLIRADSGYHLWSHTYDRDDADIFAVQDDIAKAVVGALQGKLEGGTAAADAARGTTNSEAYNQYLLGRKLDQQSTPDGNQHAIEAYERAIALDPHFGAAYARLGMTEAFVANDTGEMRGIERASQHVDRAIAVAPADARGYSARSFIRANWVWDWAGARADIEKALSLDPRNRDVQHDYAQLLDSVGRLSEAIAAEKRATELDPLSNSSWTNLGTYYTEFGDYAAAQTALSRAIELEPTNSFSLFDVGTLHLLQRRYEEALETYLSINQHNWFRWTGVAMAEYSLGHRRESQQALDELIAKLAQQAAYQIAVVFAWCGETDRAFEWLEQAYQQRDAGLAQLKSDPLLRSLRRDTRYRALLLKLKLPE